MGVHGVIHRRGNRKRSFVFTGARNMLPERRALVAQLVEQRFCKPKVGGSIPSGGTSLAGGKGTVVGTALGALLLALIFYGLPLIGINEPSYKKLIQASIIFLGAVLDSIQRRYISA